MIAQRFEVTYDPRVIEPPSRVPVPDWYAVRQAISLLFDQINYQYADIDRTDWSSLRIERNPEGQIRVSVFVEVHPGLDRLYLTP